MLFHPALCPKRHQTKPLLPSGFFWFSLGEGLQEDRKERGARDQVFICLSLSFPDRLTALGSSQCTLPRQQILGSRNCSFPCSCHSEESESSPAEPHGFCERSTYIFGNGPLLKPSENYPNLSVPSVSSWDTDSCCTL